MTSRNYTFTLNNYLPEDEIVVQSLPKTKYIVYGREVGESGTPHLQGYVAFANVRSFDAIKKLLPKAHWEVAKASAELNRKYCVKDGDIYEYGIMPITRKEASAKGAVAARARWLSIIAISESGDWGKLKEEHPDFYATSMHKAKAIYANRPMDIATLDGDFQNEWLYGPPGTGKSVTARDENPGAYIKDPQTHWWDGYRGEDTVIIDDFDKYQVKQGGDMKRCLDRYPFQAQVKGTYSLIRPKKIVITSNYHPDEIWDDEITQTAIKRRLNIRHFDNSLFKKVRLASSQDPLSLSSNA